MKRIMAATLIVGLVAIGLVGCTEKTASTKHETKIATPGGTTTITIKKEEVEKTGKNPSPTTP